MGDSATDSDVPSGAALAVALGGADEAGLLAAHDAYGPELLAYAEFLLGGPPEPEVDPAGEAVLDALLVATGAVADLTDPDRMLAWLLALTRNECLRRGAVAEPEAEAAELGRCGLGPLEVAEVLGFAPAALPRRMAPARIPPAWLQVELIAAAGPAGAVRRAELTRRARPFEPDGFPVPLDRRRLSGKVLAWSAAAVVVIALGLLVGLPTKGNAGAAAVAAVAPAERAAPRAPAPPAEEGGGPIPTLGSTPFGSASSGSSTTAGPATSTVVGAPATTPAAPAAPQAGTEAADRGSRTSGTVELTWTQDAGLDCGDQWTAHLHATTGGVEVSRVVAMAPRAGTTVTLHRDGDGWSGDLAGLPTRRPVTVMVFADGEVQPASERVRADC